MDWIELLKYLGTASVVVAAAAWLAKAIISQFLARDLEAHKLKLQHEKNEAIERLRADLRPIAYAAEVRAAELLKRRADVIAEVYSRLAVAHGRFGDLMKMVTRPNEPTQEEKAKLAADAGQEFLLYYDKKKVFLPADVCGLLDRLRQTFLEAWLNFTRYGVNWPTGIEPGNKAMFKSKEDAWRAVEKDVPTARAELERELRILLGDTVRE